MHSRKVVQFRVVAHGQKTIKVVHVHMGVGRACTEEEGPMYSWREKGPFMAKELVVSYIRA